MALDDDLCGSKILMARDQTRMMAGVSPPPPQMTVPVGRRGAKGRGGLRKQKRSRTASAPSRNALGIPAARGPENADFDHL